MPAAFNKSAFDCLTIENVKNYFAQINPIAEQIIQDISDTEAAYGHIWHTLSFNEQSDIIDETLIKPEIALRYIDSISSSSSSSSPLENANIKKSFGSSSYDGRNLRTFAIQRVAFKLLHDDTVGVSGLQSDEHSSLPFSYKTKSQTNIQLFSNNTGQQTTSSAKKSPAGIFLRSVVPPLSGTSLMEIRTTAVSNLPQIKSIARRPCNISDQKEEHSVNENVYNLQTTPDFFRNKKTECASYLENKPNLHKNMKENHTKKNILNLPHIISASSVYEDDPFIENEEFSRLVLGNSEMMLTSSSAATSDDDDDKTLYEGVRLLDTECTTNLSKGFDFLNNW